MCRSTVTWAIACVPCILSGCSETPTGPDELPPAINTSRVEPNQHNVLSAIVTVRARHADSIVVRYRLADDVAGADNATPAVSVQGELAAVPVLGLLPERRYVVRAVAYGKGGTVLGDPLEITTAALPLDLPRYIASGPDPSPGYVLFAVAPYVLVIDNSGRVVWYRRFPNGPGLNVMAQPTGRYVLRPPTPDPTDIEPWVELDPLGRGTRTLSCARGLQPRLHDLMLEQDGSYWIMCDEVRTMDLSATGGVANARVAGTVIQHVAADGALLFQWSPFDHFDITDLDPAERAGATVNWTHGNALDVDTDGNLLVSFRSLGEITKIDVTTGVVIWRLGGRRNQFTFVDTPTPAFSRQHSVRSCAPGTVLLLDNMGDPGESRAERYVLNEVSRTARLVHAYGSAPRVLTEIGGSVQPLSNGRTLVSFGTAGRVEEYDAEGRLTWRLAGNPGYVFRAQRIRSLYTPGIGTTR
jgi:hypothetical protein